MKSRERAGLERLEKARIVAEAALEKQAEDVVALDVREHRLLRRHLRDRDRQVGPAGARHC